MAAPSGWRCSLPNGPFKHRTSWLAKKRARWSAGSDLERCLNALFGKESGQPFGGVIARRQNVVFGIEPEDDIDSRGSRLLGPSVRTNEDEHNNEGSDAREERRSSHKL